MEWIESDELVHPADEGEWDELRDKYAAEDDPLDQVLRIAREGGCRTVVVENRYVDLDYRSEFSAFWSKKFERLAPFARRLHFFASDVAEDQLHNLSEPVAQSYLGYSILRPIPHGRVGRTVVKPPPSLDRATLTAITDEVSLYGNLLKVTGVPFCQQDVEFLRCAQAAAWICHYVAERKGQVGRQTTASIVEATPSFLSHERALPSKGMNLHQLQAVFSELEQPALLYSVDDLPPVRGVTNPSPALDANHEIQPHGYWDTRIISVICRYLNSGFPVLVTGGGHAFVIVGWFRDGPDQIKFIACDDQIGPYELIESPFTHYRAPWEHIMVPLPPKVYLSGESAESRAYQVFRGAAVGSSALKAMADALQGGGLQLRSSLKEGRKFKLEVADQTASDDTLRILRRARLPHWVWLIEAHDVSACHVGDPCVYAAAIYDTTSFDKSRAPGTGLCALSLPGGVAVYPPDAEHAESVPGGPAPWRSMLRAH